MQTENQQSILSRLWIYQAERFPIFGHGLLIASFSFSAISYSRICRGAKGFIDIKTYLAGIAITISLFLLVRIFDEFKDAEDDKNYRKHLPVPRGLVSFKELAILGAMALAFQLLINLLFFPKMLAIYFLVIGYLCLMGKEFFVSDWLKGHPFWYVVSHMMIIPLVDIYASGLDWLLEGVNAPRGLVFFFVVSFMNGVVLEIGRKIKVSDEEEFNTYSTLLGASKATLLWILMLLVTFLFSALASWFAGYGLTGFLVLLVLFSICSMPAILFLIKQTAIRSKFIEYASAVWTFAMYLTLGGIPMLTKLLNS